MKSTLRFIFTSIILFGVWFLLSGKTELTYLLIGLGTSLVIAYMVTPFGRIIPFSVLKFVTYLPWLIIEVLKADIAVARIVLRKDMNIEPVFVKQQTRFNNPKLLTLLGCSITLTPGTLTIYVNEEYIMVHALDDDAFASDIREQVIEEKIAKVMKKDVLNQGEHERI